MIYEWFFTQDQNIERVLLPTVYKRNNKHNINHTATPSMPVNAEYCELVDIYVSELCFWHISPKIYRVTKLGIMVSCATT